MKLYWNAYTKSTKTVYVIRKNIVLHTNDFLLSSYFYQTN